MIRLTRGPAPFTIKLYAKKTVKAPDGTKMTRAERELRAAIAFFGDRKNFARDRKLTDAKFVFAVYKDPELAAALEAAMGKKCAYCESDFAHVMPKDIEHFRPKSEIQCGKAKLQPGYYWLAGDWENLLVSCADCNRARQHSVPGQSRKVMLGKSTQFPLAEEAKRVRKQGKLDREDAVRLLLNPCVDWPENHLTFDEDGLIHPRPDAKGKLSLMAARSIEVYALQRKELVEKRKTVLNTFRRRVDELANYVHHRHSLKQLAGSAEELQRNAEEIRAVKKEMQTMLAADAVYLALLRDWIRGAKQRGEFVFLEQFGIDLMKLIPSVRPGA